MASPPATLSYDSRNVQRRLARLPYFCQSFIIGRFHSNLTRDTATHNFYPSWLDNKTIICTQGPDQIMQMRVNGKRRKAILEIKSFLIKYNPVARQAAYVTRQPKSELLLFDWKTRTSKVLLSQEALKTLLSDR